MRTTLLLLALTATMAAAVAASGWLNGPATAAQPPPASTLRLGDQTLVRCASEPGAFCGHLRVPLDRADPSGPRITIGYRFYPARARPVAAAGTVLPLEGGPGYSTTGSVDAGYAPMYGRLLRRWNLLAVDARGTGASSPLFCPAVQDFAGPTASAAFDRAVGRCGDALNRRWHDADGRPIHASDLFGAVAAAQDIATIVNALGLRRVDVYGDSYGSFLAQVLVREHPGIVRSVVLDSAYGLAGLDPWYQSTIRTMPAALDAVCRRSAACARSTGGRAWPDIIALARSLRRRPITGRAPGLDGRMVAVHMTVVDLVDLLNDAAEDPEIYRELDAAARAELDAHAARPLLRLDEQRLAADEDYAAQPAGDYSVELYLAVACTDYPQLFNMALAPAARRAQLERRIRGTRDRFSPFTVREWLAQNQNTETYSACLNWPARQVGEQVAAAPRLPSDIPVLVLGGELDTWTPPSGDRSVLAQLGGRGRVVEFANATHVLGEQGSACASRLIRRFVARPAAADRLGAACAAAQPPIRAVGIFPRALSQVPPATPVRPAMVPVRLNRLAAAAVQTAGDAVARLDAVDATADPGLYGGRVLASAGDVLTLAGDRYVSDVAVSGAVRVRPSPGGDGTAVQGHLIARSGGETLRLTAAFSTVGRQPARLTLWLGDRRVAAVMPAP